MKHVVRWMYFNLAGRALTIVPQKVPTLLTGPGSLKLVPSELKTLGASKPLIITDATLVKAGLSAKLEEILSGAGFAYSVYDGVLPDPSFDICSQALGVLKSSSCDSVIALGGGSVIDTAKIVRMGATHSKPLERFSGLLTCRNSGLPFIAVPTTAGTGSEATAAAVITDLKRHRKITALDPKMPPNTAILDPVLTLGLPPALTAATGADALTHAVEAYTNTLHYSDVDAQAIEAVRLVFANLPKACAQGSDIGAREAMLRASHLAGRAFTRGFVGYVHAVAHRFGERYHVPHGLANAIVLPYFLDRYIEACPERLADLYRAANLHSSTPVTGVAPGAASAGAQTEARATALAEARGFVEGVKSLFASVGLPPKAQFLQRSDIPGIAADALKEAHGTPYPVPLVMNAPELSALIETMAPDT